MDSILVAHRPAGDRFDHAVVLLFAPGHRPCVEDIRALSMTQGQFAVTLESTEGEDDVQWVELLANGLTFDLSGLAPGLACAGIESGHVLGMDEDFDPSSLEALVLSPGPHLTSGGPMIPVLRCLAWLAAEMAGLDGLQAIVWKPARTVCEPSYYREAVMRWISGGAFPGLGLTALVPLDDGSLISEGLALFTGQELHLDDSVGKDRAEAAKVAVRLLHWLVENGRVDETMSLTGPSGEILVLEPRPEQGIVHVWRGSR